jgi:hypothetical protein
MQLQRLADSEEEQALVVTGLREQVRLHARACVLD